MMTVVMERTLTAPRSARDDDAPPRPSSSAAAPGGRAPSPDVHPVRRVVTGVVVGALLMLGTASLDTFTDAEVPVLGSFAAVAAPPEEPEVVEVPAPPATPGTCLTWSRADAADTALVDCAQPHLFEQAGTVVLADQVALPDDSTWRQLVDERCGPVVMSYLGDVFDPDGRYRVGALKPSASKWEQGDRELRCGLQSASRSGALYPMTGRVAEGDQAAVQEPGVCLAIDGPRVGDPVACTGPHALETVGIVDMAADFPNGYPAVADQDAYLQPKCNEIAAAYAGGPTVVTDKGLTVYWNNISEESWAAGTYRANCNVAALLPDRSGFAPVTGPVTGDVVIGDQLAPPAENTPDAGIPAPPTTTPAAPTTAPPADGTGTPPPSPAPTEGTPPAGEVPPAEVPVEIPVPLEGT
jgi:hypothetical protein